MSFGVQSKLRLLGAGKYTAAGPVDAVFKNGVLEIAFPNVSRTPGTAAKAPNDVPPGHSPADVTNSKRKGSDMTQQASRDIEPNVSEQDAKLRRARRRVAAIKGFYLHLLIFVLVMLGLSAINFAVGGPWWVLWVLLGWGVGLLAHAFAVFSHSSKRIADWEQRKLNQFLSER